MNGIFQYLSVYLLNKKLICTLFWWVTIRRSHDIIPVVGLLFGELLWQEQQSLELIRLRVGTNRNTNEQAEEICLLSYPARFTRKYYGIREKRISESYTYGLPVMLLKYFVKYRTILKSLFFTFRFIFVTAIILEHDLYKYIPLFIHALINMRTKFFTISMQSVRICKIFGFSYYKLF